MQGLLDFFGLTVWGPRVSRFRDLDFFFYTGSLGIYEGSRVYRGLIKGAAWA